MSIVTKTGDAGQTGLYGGRRVSKDDARLHAYGTVDELNAALGLVRAEEHVPVELRSSLLQIQHQLFRLGADLATPIPGPENTKRIEPAHTKFLEALIAQSEATLSPLTAFILPGGTRAGSLLHLARTTCRRAERWTVALALHEEVHSEALIYLNRLGDCLFLFARLTNRALGATEEQVEYEA